MLWPFYSASANVASLWRKKPRMPVIFKAAVQELVVGIDVSAWVHHFSEET
jgi:hypothetical protein